MALTTPRLSGNGTGVRSDAPAIDTARRRVRVPELTIGLVLMVGFALAAVLWHMSATDRTAVLALSTDVARGETVDADDLRVVYISSDDPIAYLPRAASADVIGRVAVADLPRGSLLTREHVADRSSLGADEGVVGLALDPGQYPAEGLLPGDLVNVVTSAPEWGDPGLSGSVLARRAEVYAVEEVGTQGRRFVSVRMPEDVANRVAAAAERGPVRLVLVGR